MSYAREQKFVRYDAELGTAFEDLAQLYGVENAAAALGISERKLFDFRRGIRYRNGNRVLLDQPQPIRFLTLQVVERLAAELDPMLENREAKTASEWIKDSAWNRRDDPA